VAKEVDDPKVSKPIIREPEPAGTPIERKDPAGGDKAPTVPKTSSASKPADKPLPLPFGKRRTDDERAGVPPGTPIPQGDPFHDEKGNPVPIPDMDIPSTES
jgi:hypothetical protein